MLLSSSGLSLKCDKLTELLSRSRVHGTESWSGLALSLQLNHNSTEWVMKNKAATAPITFEEIITVMINTFKGFSPFEWKWHKEDNFSANVATQRKQLLELLKTLFLFIHKRGHHLFFSHQLWPVTCDPLLVSCYFWPNTCDCVPLTCYLWPMTHFWCSSTCVPLLMKSSLSLIIVFIKVFIVRARFSKFCHYHRVFCQTLFC